MYWGSPVLSHPKLPALGLSAEKRSHRHCGPHYQGGVKRFAQAAGKPAPAHLQVIAQFGDSHTAGFIQPEFGGDLQRLAGCCSCVVGQSVRSALMWARTVVPASPLGAMTYRPEPCSPAFGLRLGVLLDEQFESAVFASYLIDRGGGRWRRRRRVREYCWHLLRRDERPLTWCGLEVSDKDPRQPWSEVLESQACEKCCIARLER